MPFEPYTPTKIYVGNGGKVLAKVKKQEVSEKIKVERFVDFACEVQKSGRFENVDLVNKPPHYNQGKIEVSDFIADQNMNFFEGNLVKYVARYKFKNGLEDLRKASWYLNKLIEITEKKTERGE